MKLSLHRIIPLQDSSQTLQLVVHCLLKERNITIENRQLLLLE